MPRTSRARYPLAALLLSTALVHGAALGFGFVGYDDPQRVLDNPFVRDGLTAAGVRWAWTTTAHAPYPHPLTWLSHMLDCQWFGLEPAGHHATNLALHLGCVALLYAFLLRATGESRPALVAAGLFALHPVNAGTVAWISARPDLLATVFALAALWAHAARRRSWACAALAAALLSKPVAAVVPLVMLIVDRWPLGDERPLHARVRANLACWLLAAAGAATVFLDRERVGGVEGALDVPLPLRLAGAAVACLRYVGYALWPARISAHDPHPYLSGGTPWPAWLAVLAALAIVAATLGARRLPALRTGWLWFLAALAPVSGIVQIGDQGLALRYLYFPGIGLWIAAVWTVHRRVPARAAAAAALLVLALCAWGTRYQAAYWRDSRTLFARALEIHPDDPVMHYDLAVELERDGDTAGALEHYRRAVAIRPSHSRAHNNLGILLDRAGASGEALEQFRLAVRLAPGFGAAWNNLGNALRRAGRFDEAIEAYRSALATASPPPEARLHLAIALREAGRDDEALASYRAYLAERPADGDAWHDLGLLLQRTGRTAEARAALERAVELTGRADPRTLGTLAEICLRAGDVDCARSALDDALHLEDLDPAVAARLRALRDRLPPP